MSDITSRTAAQSQPDLLIDSWQWDEEELRIILRNGTSIFEAKLPGQDWRDVSGDSAALMERIAEISFPPLSNGPKILKEHPAAEVVP